MKTKNTIVRYSLAGLLSVLALGRASAQGPLVPPGAPAPGMKTLEQIEPRTPISSLPFVITEPGSYYLTGNLGSTGHGIVVRADHVTVDLMGFRIHGNQSPSHRGILVEKTDLSPIRNVVVRHGNVTDFATGIWLGRSLHARVSHVNLSSNVVEGAHILYGQGNSFEDCALGQNGERGLYVYGLGGSSDGHVLRRCILRANGQHGVRVYAVAGRANASRFEDCRILENGSHGVWLEGTAEGQISDHVLSRVTITGNGGNAVYWQAGDGRAEGNTIEHGVLSGNAGSAIRFDANLPGGSASGNRMAHLLMRGNAGTLGGGIWLRGACSGNAIERCVIADHREGSGILVETLGFSADGNRFEDNQISRNVPHGMLWECAGGAMGNVVANNIIGANQSHGLVFLATAEGRIQGNRLTDNTLADNGGSGILWATSGPGFLEGNALLRSTIHGNTAHGIEWLPEAGGFVRGNQVADNLVSANKERGIQAEPLALGAVISENRIERNTVTDNGATQIHVTGGDVRRNLIVHNMADSPLGFVLGANNAYGPIVTSVTELPQTGAPAHPWANFAPSID